MSCVSQVILGIVFPPYILALDFKSKEELQLMPQTMEEHMDELEDAASVADVSMSSFSEDQVYCCMLLVFMFLRFLSLA